MYSKTISTTWRNFTTALMNGSPCSLILSVSHFSSFKYSLREARHARSITNGNDWAFNRRERAWNKQIFIKLFQSNTNNDASYQWIITYYWCLNQLARLIESLATFTICSIQVIKGFHLVALCVVIYFCIIFTLLSKPSCPNIGRHRISTMIAIGGWYNRPTKLS